MRLIRGNRLVLGVVLGLAVGAGASTLAVDDASAQTLSVQGQCAVALLPLPGTCNDTGDGGNADADGGNGGHGGNGGNGGNGGLFTTVHDVGNAQADASNLVIVHDITTGDATVSD